MKILHTGDWHLGKNLEGASRIDEQKLFLKDFEDMVKNKNIDVVLIAGDVFDTFNPSSQAETLFYKTLKNISENGERLIVVIPGNHDNPQRLVSARPLAKEHGIIMVDAVKTIIEPGFYGQNEVVHSGMGFIEVMIKGERLVLVTVPYPSEKRLDELYLIETTDEALQLQSYQEKMHQVFHDLSLAFKDDSLNIIMTHLFALGAEETGSERSIQLGGTYIVDSSCFPIRAHYVALGHIHKPMIIPHTDKRVRYAGSPLQYNKKERHFQKGCYILDGNHNHLQIDFEAFKIYKPIEVWQLDSVEAALLMCEEKSEENTYVYMEIATDRYIQEHEIKAMRRLKKDIIEIKPILAFEDFLDTDIAYTEEPIESLFEAFYLKERKTHPTDEVKALLMSILGRDDETN